MKSSAYLQAWFQRHTSTVSFSIKPSRAWDPQTNVLSAQASRQADVYVFALLAHGDKTTLDPMDVDQWQFFVLPTSVLNARTRSQHSITLKSLEALCRSASFAELRASVEQALRV